MKRFFIILTAIALTFSFLITCTFTETEKVFAADDRVLSFDWNLIESVGRQTPNTSACACFSLAYCRSILDGYVHSWGEYDQNGGTNQNNGYCMWGWGDYSKGHSASTLGALQAVYNTLNQGRPAILYVTGRGSSQHWVTIIGYKVSANYNDLNVYDFLMIDPVVYAASYENLGNAGYSVKAEGGSGYAYVTANSGGVPFPNSTKPSKPSVTVSASDSAHPVTVSYNACENATHYDIRFYDSSDKMVWAIGQCDDGAAYGNLVAYTDTSYSHTFDKGSYYVTVAAVNNNTAEWNYSDAVSFTVAEAPKYPDKPVVTVEVTSENHPVKVSYTACANATDYCIRYYDASDKLLYAIGDSEDSKLFGNGSNYTETSHSYTFPAGTYKVTVAAINETDSVWTFSDPVFFTVSASVRGDINADGEIDSADVDLLMNWLLAVPKTTLKDAEAADMNGDGKLNAVDLTLLKREVLIVQGLIITLNKSALTLNTEGKSKSYQLTCSYPVVEDVVWKSSNVAVATVKNGLVTAQKDGTAMITATANGNSVSCTVTVKTAYEETWSDWSDWTATPITASDSVEVKTEERSSQVLVSYNIDYYCTRTKDKKRQFRNYSINPADYGLDTGYGQNTTQTAFGVPYLVKTVDELNAVAKIQPGEWSTGSQAGQNCADVVGYSFDGCIFYILGENYDTVSTTYYSSRHLVKTPVEYQN